MSNPFAGLFGKETSSRINNPFDGLFQSPQSASDQQQQTQLLQQQAQANNKKSQGTSLFSKLKRVALDVGKGAEKAGAAVVRPVADVATGKGGKAVHDTAQLGNDVTGGAGGYFAENDIIEPAKQLIAQATGNKKAESASFIRQNQELELGKKGTNLKGGLLKLGGNAVTTALIPVGGGEAAAAKDLVQQGGKIAAKDLAERAAKDALIGDVGGAANTVAQNPDASMKEIVHNAVVGAALGGAMPVAGKIFGAGAKTVLTALKSGTSEAEKTAPKAMEDVMTPEQADKAAAAQYTKITPEDKSAGAEEVGVRTPIRPGIKQTSATYKVGVRVAQPMSDGEYTKQFNALSNAYQKEMNALKGKGAETQKVVAEHIDKKYQALINDLNDNYKNGVMPKETTVKRVSSVTTPAEKTTGGAPKSGVNVQSEAYKVGAASRIKPEEAAAKLKAAGYTAPETKTILSDALPEKGLSMPGSPKKIGLNDASVKESAANFDKQKAPVETQKGSQPTPVISENASKTAPQEQASITSGVPVKSPSTEGTSLKPLQSVEANPEQGTSKLGTSVREKALQDKIISKTEAEAQDLPAYNKANMKQQAAYATDLIKNNPEQAVNIALGKAEAPAHILPQMVYNAVEEYARGLGGEDGAKLLLDLSRSKQVSSLTTMAQNVRAAAERDPHSPTNMINDVATTRAKALEKRGKSVSKIAQKDATAIKKVTPKVTKDDWTAFVDGLRC